MVLVKVVFSRYYKIMSSDTIYNYVERLSELLRGDSRLAGAEHGLQPVQLESLHYLSICNRYSDTPMGVTQYLGQTKGTVSQTLKVLEKKGLLIKAVDTNDKRILHLKITDKGKKLLTEIIPTGMFVAASKSLLAKKKKEVEQSLKELLTTLLQANNLKTFGICKSCRHNSKMEDAGYYCNLLEQPLTNDDVQLICKDHEN